MHTREMRFCIVTDKENLLGKLCLTMYILFPLLKHGCQRYLLSLVWLYTRSQMSWIHCKINSLIASEAIHTWKYSLPQFWGWWKPRLHEPWNSTWLLKAQQLLTQQFLSLLQDEKQKHYQGRIACVYDYLNHPTLDLLWNLWKPKDIRMIKKKKKSN